MTFFPTWHKQILHLTPHVIDLNEELELIGKVTGAFFLDFKIWEKEENILKRIIQRMCKNLDSVMFQTKNMALSRITYFLFQNKTMIANIRSKRKKLFFYASYLPSKINFDTFVYNLNLRKIIREKRKIYFSNKLYSKIKRFYNIHSESYRRESRSID